MHKSNVICSLRGHVHVEALFLALSCPADLHLI